MNQIAKWCFAFACILFAVAANAIGLYFITNEHIIVGSGSFDIGETLVDGHVVAADGTYAIGGRADYPYEIGMLDVHAPVFSSQYPPGAAFGIYAQSLSLTVKGGAITDFHGFFGWSRDPTLRPVQGMLTLNSDLTFSYIDKDLGVFPSFDVERSGSVQLLTGIPVSVVPEPEPLPLLATGIVMVVGAARRRFKKPFTALAAKR